MASLSLKHIYKVYPNGVKAVNDFTMEIEDKEFIVFVGPSGCGKSTTLRMIAGLEDITAGELKIGDLVVNDVEPKDRDIAMVFQNYALYPHMTVFENIAFGLRLRKMPREEINRRVQEAAEILGITEYLGRKPKEMSGGQRQRVSLGRAIVREPKVMLLDEPLSNLDAKLRTQMRSEIAKLHKRLGTTFIYVTHDQIEAMTMGTRIVVMKDGFVQQIDTPKNLYNYPGNKFVAGFIGTPQMNFFEGTLKKMGDNVEIAFKYTDAKVVVPYSYFYKTRPAYLNGETNVIIGLRAENVSLDPETVAKSNATIKVKISHKEELGNETLIYGDINMDGDGYTESSTRIIIKSVDEVEHFPGDIVEAALDLDHVHLFDAETEISILPRIPEYNYLDCEVQDKTLTFLGEKVTLPPAIECESGVGELLIPSDAIKLGGDITAKVIGTEVILGKKLLSMEISGRRIFAVVDEDVTTPTVNISIDMKKITILRDGKEVVSPMPETVSFDGNFTKKKVVEDVPETEAERAKRLAKEQKKAAKETPAEDGQGAEENAAIEQAPAAEEPVVTKRKKVVKFSLEIENAEFPAPEEIAQKLIAALTIKRVFDKKYRFECTPYDLTLAEEGIKAEVVSVADYGAERFAKCKVGEKTIYVKLDDSIASLGETVHLVPDIDKLAIIQADMDIRLV